MAELADASDLKSGDLNDREGSIPSSHPNKHAFGEIGIIVDSKSSVLGSSPRRCAKCDIG